MIRFDNTTGENIKKHNANQPQICDYLYRIFMVGGSGSRKQMHY